MPSPSLPPDAGPRKGSTDRALGLALITAASILAALLYRPDTNIQFEIIDFSETLPFLVEGRDFGDRFLGLVQYYLQHGRLAVGLSAGLAAKWAAFGWWTPGWQWTRYLVGLAVVILAWRLMRRLGANRAGAAVGASLFIVAETAAPGWLRPSVSEPFGTLVLLAAALLACGYQASQRPVRLAVGIAALLATMVLVKETLVAATFFPIAVALACGPDGRLGMPVRSRRNALLVGACAIALVLTSIPVIWAYLQMAPDAYAQQFEARAASLSNAIFGLLPAIVPFAPVTQPVGWAATAADVAWLIILTAGLRSVAASRGTRIHVLIVTALGIALVAARVLVYLPWPYQHPFYSLPYLLGVALIASLSVSGLTQGPSHVKVMAGICVVAVLLYSAAGSLTYASRYMATRRLTDALVDSLHHVTEATGTEPFAAAVVGPPPLEWSGLGSTLSRFGNATGRRLPPGRTIHCTDAARMVSSPGGTDAILVALRWQCVLPGKPTLTVRSAIVRVGREGFWTADTLYADILTPAMRGNLSSRD